MTTKTMNIHVTMKPIQTPAGWEIFRGREWPTHEALDLALASAVEGRRFSHFSTDKLIHVDHWILDYHFSNNIRFRTTKSRWQPRIPGTWHLYPPKVPWFQDTRKTKLPLHAIWIRFHGGEKIGISRLVDNPLGIARFHDPGGWLMERVSALATLGDLQDEREYPQALMGMMEIIQKLLHSPCTNVGEYTLDVPGTSQPQEPLVAKVNEYMVAHLHEPVTLAKMAKELHTSISTLHRRYTASTKQSIAQTLIRMRLSRAKQLLIEGTTVAQAAEGTGFADPFHLSRTFRRLEGIPPREFLSRLRRTARVK